MVAVSHRKALPAQRVKKLYTPSRWQEVFQNLPYDEALGAGSVGPGKTTCLLHECDKQIQIEHDRCYRASDHEHPLHWGESKGWGLYLRRTFRELTQVIRETKKVFPAMDPGARWVEESSDMPLGWIFSSGFRYQFGHCLKPDDWTLYYGLEYTKVCFDELISFTEEQYDNIITRVRTDDPVLSDPKLCNVRAMSNPVVRRSAGEAIVLGKNPHWVRERFVDPAPKGETVLRRIVTRRDGRQEVLTRIYLPARLWDNPNKEFVNTYERKLIGMKTYLKKALLEGSWYHLEGAFFRDEWDPDIHVIKPFHIPAHWKRFRSMDWGFQTQGCIHWWAMDDDENIYCEREFSFRKMTADKVAARVRLIEKGLGLWDENKKQSMISGPADSQLWEKRGESGRSKAEEFSAAGVNWVPADKAKGNRHRNAERLAERMKSHENGTTLPGFLVFDTCSQLLKTIPAIQANPDDPETPMDGGEDHWLDSAFYACAYASHGRGAIASISRPKKDRPEEEGYWDDDDEDAHDDRGQYGYGAF